MLSKLKLLYVFFFHSFLPMGELDPSHKSSSDSELDKSLPNPELSMENFPTSELSPEEYPSLEH